MRNWIILFEMTLSIMLLILFYFLILNYPKYYKKFSVYDQINWENFREILNKQCVDNLIYSINDLVTNSTIICIKGNKSNLEDLEKYEMVEKRIFSGKDSYNPFILIIYKE